MQQISMLKQETLDSRQVAEMLDKNHADLLKDIAKIRDYFREGKITFSEYFVESQYRTDTNWKVYKNYQITKKGCEFLAHKLTGARGAAFTAKYIDAFHDMQNTLALPNETMLGILQVQTKILERLERLETKKTMATGYGGTSEEIEALLNRQRKSRNHGKTKLLLVETLPPEIRIIIDRLMLDKSRNYTFIRKVLAEKGYKISESALRNYYQKSIAKTEGTKR